MAQGAGGALPRCAFRSWTAWNAVFDPLPPAGYGSKKFKGEVTLFDGRDEVCGAQVGRGRSHRKCWRWHVWVPYL